MKLSDLLGKSWVIKEHYQNQFTVIINVTGIDLFKFSIDETAGEIAAEAVYKIRQSKWLEDSVKRINGKYPINVEATESISEIEELSYDQAIKLVRETIRSIFPEMI